MRYRGNNLDKIYKAANRSIINSNKEIDPRRLRACLEKAGYDTEFEAQVFAAKRDQDYYQCRYCPHYHLTTKKYEKNKSKEGKS